jgi:hypothetical protein
MCVLYSARINRPSFCENKSKTGSINSGTVLLSDAVLRIRDPGSLVKKAPYPGSGSATKNVSILTQKILVNLSEIWSWMFIPDHGTQSQIWIFPIPDPQHWPYVVQEQQ